MDFIPQVYIVGFQKCGSSTLFNHLASHPMITGANPKETFFLVDNQYDRFSPDKNISNTDSSWNTFFDKKKEGANILMEASVCNFYQNRALDYISNLSADIKVIFIVRNPVDRFISVFKYLSGKINGIPPEDDINVFFENVRNGGYDRHLLKHAIEHGHYTRFISRWEQELGKDRVLVVGFKELINEPQIVINKVCQYLNIETFKLQDLNLHSNASLGYRFPRLHKYLVACFGGGYLGEIALVKRVYSFMFSRVVSVSLSEVYRQELITEYEKEFIAYGSLF